MLACCIKLRTLVAVLVKAFVIFAVTSETFLVGSEARRLRNRSRKQKHRKDLAEDDPSSSPVFLTLRRSERSPTMVLPKGHLPPLHSSSSSSQGRRRRGSVRRLPRSKNSYSVLSQSLSQSQFQKIYNQQNRNSARANLGSTRKMRLYCRIGIGYHLEINRKGKVLARHKTTPDGQMNILSVEPGVVGIQSITHGFYLCMDKKGRLTTSKSWRRECEFRESIEDNLYNTYASEMYSNHAKRKGYYLGISPKGKPRRGKKMSYWQRRAQWLPRNI